MCAFGLPDRFLGSWRNWDRTNRYFPIYERDSSSTELNLVVATPHFHPPPPPLPFHFPLPLGVLGSAHTEMAMLQVCFALPAIQVCWSKWTRTSHFLTLLSKKWPLSPKSASNSSLSCHCRLSHSSPYFFFFFRLEEKRGRTRRIWHSF